MSITNSTTEFAEARERLAAAATEQLERDLVFWAVRRGQHRDAFEAATKARSDAGELYGEADAWTELLGTELARRHAGRQA